MDGSSLSLKTDHRPPGSKERKRGLNPSPLWDPVRGKFYTFSNHNIRVWIFILGFTSGNSTSGKNGIAGTTMLSRAGMDYLLIHLKFYLMHRGTTDVELPSPKVTLDNIADDILHNDMLVWLK
jgi:hypothetical protein